MAGLPEPSYRVVFLIARGEDNFEFGGDFYSNLGVAAQPERVKAAVSLAEGLIGINEEVGRYG